MSRKQCLSRLPLFVLILPLISCSQPRLPAHELERPLSIKSYSGSDVCVLQPGTTVLLSRRLDSSSDEGLWFYVPVNIGTAEAAREVVGSSAPEMVPLSVFSGSLAGRAEGREFTTAPHLTSDQVDALVEGPAADLEDEGTGDGGR